MLGNLIQYIEHTIGDIRVDIGLYHMGVGIRLCLLIINTEIQ